MSHSPVSAPPVGYSAAAAETSDLDLYLDTQMPGALSAALDSHIVTGLDTGSRLVRTLC